MAPSAIPGISTETPCRRIPASPQASPMVQRACPTTLAPPSSLDPSAVFYRRTPRRADRPNKARQADKSYQKSPPVDTEEPPQGGALQAGKGVPQGVRHPGRRDPPPAPPVKVLIAPLSPPPPQDSAYQP